MKPRKLLEPVMLTRSFCFPTTDLGNAKFYGGWYFSAMTISPQPPRCRRAWKTFHFPETVQVFSNPTRIAQSIINPQ